MAEFWEQAFKDKKEMWGLEPAQSNFQKTYTITKLKHTQK